MDGQEYIQSIAESLRLIDEIQVKLLETWARFASSLQSCVDMVEENQRREDAMRDREVTA